MLEVKNINAFYGKKQVLFDIFLKIREGERVLLLGPNGAGKSTLLKVMAGLLRAPNGDIFYKGRDITKWPTEKRIKSGIGYLLQTENIVPELTVEENLLLGGYKLNSELLKERLDGIFDVFGFLKDNLKKRAGLLSGGERQALAISMVLMKRPKLLLLDEPSAGLSPKAAAGIIEHIEKAQEKMGISSICMVEHNLKFSLRWAERVIILVGGSFLHESSQPEEYLSHPDKLEDFFFKT